ncbi:hypothetical protein RD792_008872 [Penstemon davidsonii]|uniref:F-box domain-containing protein n=1 Tax=Penstemon davidsonii TaxID=160366 RepID=A0ABR0DBX6_9LAMI|nr:hypothetical protein RD792_008872 [Penstemon davidsonii]
MESDPSEKCPEIECIDLISTMPDSILGKILSYLPIENAVATSILSTRWKNLFPFGVPPIKIYLYDPSGSYRPGQNTRSFMNFVDKLLNETLLDVPCVQTIVIYSKKLYSNDKIGSWVSAAVLLNVVHLNLMSKPSHSKALFHSLNGCATLVKLDLGINFELCIPGEFILPNLKRLMLCMLLIRDDNIHKLLDGCPVLDYLLFSECDLGVLDNLTIQSQLLKKLLIVDCFFNEGCEVEIDAPDLEVFVYDGSFVVNCVLADHKSLHTVCIEYNVLGEVNDVDDFVSNVRHVAKLVKACSSTIRLSLSNNVAITALHHSPDQLPLFKNLTCLALGRVESHGFEVLAHLLKSAPSLQTLTFEDGFEKCDGGYDRFESLLPTSPICLILCLKKIEFWEFKGEEDEIKFIEYFLKNGRVLQEVTVHYLPCEDSSILNRLLVFPKDSKTCQIILTEYDDIDRPSDPYSREKWITGV